MNLHTILKLESIILTTVSYTMAMSVPCRFESRLVGKTQRERRERAQSMNISSSKSIPIQMNRQDMLEEWEIREQEMIADERDYFMFHRIINGMIARQGASHHSSSASSYHSETEKSIASILRTRYKKVESDAQKPDEDSDAFANDGAKESSPASSMDDDDENRPPETIFIMDM